MSYEPRILQFPTRGGPVGQNGHREIAFFHFWPSPGISLSAKGRPRPKWPKKTRILRFPARGGPVGQHVKGKKVADKHPGHRGNFFFQFWDPWCRETAFFCFQPAPGIYLRATGRPGPKWPEITVSRDFPPLGVRSAKT